MRYSLAIAVFSCGLMLGACVSSPSSTPEGADAGISADAAYGGTSSVSRTDEMNKLMDTARAALDANHLAEGIRSYVAVLALAKEDRTADSARLGAQAEAELVRIGTRLSLEPGESWIAPDGSQKAGSTRYVGKEGSLEPSVYLFENWGSGKSPVQDAPIRFEFLRGAGVLTASAATDTYGRANAILSRLDSTAAEAVVRAYPAFTVRGYTYSFKTVQRDFSYLPPSNVAKVIALERGPGGTAANPQVLDAVASLLKNAGLAASPLDGKLLGMGFDKAFGGDPGSMRSLASVSGASYFAFVLSESFEPRQMEYGGKKYNIFTCDCKTTLRIVRDDGTIVFALPLDIVRGQGGTPQAAVGDSYAKAQDTLIAELNKRLPEIRRSIEGGL